jgi:hypothetical protein
MDKTQRPPAGDYYFKKTLVQYPQSIPGTMLVKNTASINNTICTGNLLCKQTEEV